MWSRRQLFTPAAFLAGAGWLLPVAAQVPGFELDLEGLPCDERLERSGGTELEVAARCVLSIVEMPPEELPLREWTFSLRGEGPGVSIAGVEVWPELATWLSGDGYFSAELRDDAVVIRGRPSSDFSEGGPSLARGTRISLGQVRLRLTVPEPRSECESVWLRYTETPEAPLMFTWGERQVGPARTRSCVFELCPRPVDVDPPGCDAAGLNVIFQQYPAPAATQYESETLFSNRADQLFLAPARPVRVYAAVVSQADWPLEGWELSLAIDGDVELLGATTEETAGDLQPVGSRTVGCVPPRRRERRRASRPVRCGVDPRRPLPGRPPDPVPRCRRC